MKKPLPNAEKLSLVFVSAFTLLIVIFLSCTTYYINYWPTDSENPYLPTAAKLFQMPYISDIHRLPLPGILKVNMHGKEALILGIAVMQKVFRDTASLFPNVFLLILAVGISGILVYLVTRGLLDNFLGLVAFLLFSTTFWPYQYVIFGAHPPLALMNFLFAILFLQLGARTRLAYLASGMFLAIMFFSSPTATIFVPYYLGFWSYRTFLYPRRQSPGEAVGNISLLTAGASVVFLFFTAPHPIENLKGLDTFINVSKYGNNFAMYHDYLQRFFPLTKHFRGAGWLWILKYLFLILPVLSSAYLLSAIYLLWQGRRKRHLLFLLALSLAAPLAVETSQVVQFGRNYFPWLVGILGLVVFTLYDIHERLKDGTFRFPKVIFYAGTALLLIAHAATNAFAFFGDVLPTRMATTDRKSTRLNSSH